MSLRKILFLDRDGTLIEEPDDFQIDSLAKFRLVPGVIPALLKLKAAGYEFVMVSNQDGLGTPGFPRETFTGPHELMMQVFASQGIVFREVLIDESFPHQNLPTRKPGIGLAMHYLRDRSIDLDGSAMVGDRDTDIEGVTRMENGEPSGELCEFAAMFPVMRLIGSPFRTVGVSEDGLRMFGKVAQWAGVTTATDLVNELGDEGLETLARVTAEPDYPVRIVPAASGAIFLASNSTGRERR